MYLTKEEEKILDGEFGEGIQKAMELIVALGEINEAERLVSIRSAQVSGVSYKTIGDAGIEFLKDWSKCKVRVLTTLNPAGIDLENWKKFRISNSFVEKQKKIINYFREMGILISCTCTPYLIGNLPRFGEHIAWAESSAVVFANSVLGARSNRESGISALACAIVGKTPLYGMHLKENREAELLVKVSADLKEQSDYSALGYYIARHFNQIPRFTNITPTLDELKALSASLGIGAINMFQIEGVTPEISGDGLEKIEIGDREIREVYEELSSCEDYDIICVGCPHCSLEELKRLKRIKTEKKLWVYTARQNKWFFKNAIFDTCMVVSPLEDMGIEGIATNSAKAAFYCRNLSNLDVKFAPIRELL